VPFSINRGGVSFQSNGPRIIEGHMGDNVLLIASASGTAESLLQSLTADADILPTEPSETTVGDQPATQADLRLAESAPPNAACGEPCAAAIIVPDAAGGQYGWFVVDGRPNRAWLVDVDGKTVAIFAESDESDFESWTQEVQALLDTVSWSG
jgi:hypothetical protein